MIPYVSIPADEKLIAHLRQMAAAGASIGDLIAQLRQVFPGPDNTLPLVRYLWRAFHLTIREARLIEGSALLGRTLYTAEQTEELIRPLIDRNRDLWCRVD
jgi:hypothetical protein